MHYYFAYADKFRKSVATDGGYRFLSHPGRERNHSNSGEAKHKTHYETACR